MSLIEDSGKNWLVLCSLLDVVLVLIFSFDVT